MKVCDGELDRDKLVALLMRAAADILRLESEVGYLERERKAHTNRLLRQNITRRDHAILHTGEATVPPRSTTPAVLERRRDLVRAARVGPRT